MIDIIEKEGKGEHESEWTFTKKLINIYGVSSALMYLNSHKIHHSTPNLKQILVDLNYYPKNPQISIKLFFNSLLIKIMHYHKLLL